MRAQVNEFEFNHLEVGTLSLFTSSLLEDVLHYDRL